MTNKQINNIKEYLMLEEIDELDNSEEMIEEIFREVVDGIANESVEKEK